MNISPSLYTTSCFPVSPSYFRPPPLFPFLLSKLSPISPFPCHSISFQHHFFLRSSSPAVSHPLSLIHAPFILHSSPPHMPYSPLSSFHIPLSFDSGIVRGRWMREGVIKMTVPVWSNNFLYNHLHQHFIYFSHLYILT